MEVENYSIFVEAKGEITGEVAINEYNNSSSNHYSCKPFHNTISDLSQAQAQAITLKKLVEYNKINLLFFIGKELNSTINER